MAEPTWDLSVEELTSSPQLWGKVLRAVALGRRIRLMAHGDEPVADVVPDSLIQDLEETIEVLSDPEAVQALIEARQAAAHGDVIRGTDAVRALLDRRK